MSESNPDHSLPQDCFRLPLIRQTGYALRNTETGNLISITGEVLVLDCRAAARAQLEGMFGTHGWEWVEVVPLTRAAVQIVVTEE